MLNKDKLLCLNDLWGCSQTIVDDFLHLKFGFSFWFLLSALRLIYSFYRCVVYDKHPLVPWSKSVPFGLKRIFHIIGTFHACVIFIASARQDFFEFVISNRFWSDRLWLSVIWPELFMLLVLDSEPIFEGLSCCLAEHRCVFILSKKLAGRYEFSSRCREWLWQLYVNRRCQLRWSRSKVLNTYILVFLHRSL